RAASYDAHDGHAHGHVAGASDADGHVTGRRRQRPRRQTTTTPGFDAHSRVASAHANDDDGHVTGTRQRRRPRHQRTTTEMATSPADATRPATSPVDTTRRRSTTRHREVLGLGVVGHSVHDI
ncbi:hypothetical protein CYLTODRAFT_460636, partial [Cylindrobasidium torrendii FP15055 ss-10]